MSIEEGERINEAIPYNIRPHEIEAFSQEEAFVSKIENSSYSQKLKEMLREIISSYTATHRIEMKIRPQNIFKGIRFPRFWFDQVKIRGIVIEPGVLNANSKSHVACILIDSTCIKLYATTSCMLTEPITIVLSQGVPLSVLNECSISFNPLVGIEVKVECPNNKSGHKGFILYGLGKEDFVKSILRQSTEISAHTLYTLLKFLMKSINENIDLIAVVQTNDYITLKPKVKRLKELTPTFHDLGCGEGGNYEIGISGDVIEIKLNPNSKVRLGTKHLKTLTMRELFKNH